MGTRIQNLANNFTTAGIVKAAAVNNTTVSGITSLPSGVGGALTLIKSVTASSSASIEFINGTSGVVLDGTYLSYVFKFIELNPDTDVKDFQFQGSTNGGSTYGVTITSTMFKAQHAEADGSEQLIYQSDRDLAQSTSFQSITNALGNGVDECVSGSLQIFNPSSTTYVKHFISETNELQFEDVSMNCRCAGYFNTTSAINAIKFQMSSGNFDGIIKLYGVS